VIVLLRIDSHRSFALPPHTLFRAGWRFLLSLYVTTLSLPSSPLLHRSFFGSLYICFFLHCTLTGFDTYWVGGVVGWMGRAPRRREFGVSETAVLYTPHQSSSTC
jgi:hypothetical protein